MNEKGEKKKVITYFYSRKQVNSFAAGVCVCLSLFLSKTIADVFPFDPVFPT